MGEITLVRDGMPDLLPMQGRSPGIHISQIIRYLCIRLGHFEDRGEEAWNQAQLELGNAFEHAIVERYALNDPDRYVRPGELERDKLFGSPDLLDIIEETVDELKCTWMSSMKHDVEGEKFWRYWVQIKAYCYMMGWSVGRLHVLFVNGDYRNSGPVYRVWRQEFTQQELWENWQMLLSHAAYVTPEGHS